MMNDKVKTGLLGFDGVIDKLRLGDNVVWQVESIACYKKVVMPFVKQALSDGRKLVYIRFGRHEPLFYPNEAIEIHEIDAKKGFESFATEVYRLVEALGLKVFYVFDFLTDLLDDWCSDLMIGNFFKVICPFLYQLDTIAYFALQRHAHTYSTIAGIRETTQLLLDVYQVDEKMYIHPLKVWKRYSPTMFFPHLIDGDQAVCITGSSESAALFSSLRLGVERLDYWEVLFNQARESLMIHGESEENEAMKTLLITKMISPYSRMTALCQKYFSLDDVLRIQSREIGTGFIGGKSVGMLLARKIMEIEGEPSLITKLEAHDSFYIGSDVFYTYIVQNGWWQLRTKQKTKDGYYQYADELKACLLQGSFPDNIKEKYMQVLEYFGQSPIIVRSSSLQEDNFGNAFAGKYESVFCANQGTEEERYKAFEHAVRLVYASTMNADALDYRLNRGLCEEDEQMAILVQRVSGDFYENDFFPHGAGVGNSFNLYVWDKMVDMESGMLRLVFGLGTRAVDRTVGDYGRIVCLDDPKRMPPMNYGDEKKYSQHYVDVIGLQENALTTKSLDDFINRDLKVERQLFMRLDENQMTRLREHGYKISQLPYILDMKQMLETTTFAESMKHILSTLARVYDYPVDIEFTVNFMDKEHYKINLLQCRPLQTRGLGKPIHMPLPEETKLCLFTSKGNFMGGNVHLSLDWIILIKPKAYHELSEQKKYEFARFVGKINQRIESESIMIMGPGRFGTTTPSLGVPVHFSELSNMKILCEVASKEEAFTPELSYGSHFFQDIVETGIFYIALFDGEEAVSYEPAILLEQTNQLLDFIDEGEKWQDVLHMVRANGLELFSDIVSQSLICAIS